MVKQYAQLYIELLRGTPAELGAEEELVAAANAEEDSGNADDITNRAAA